MGKQKDLTQGIDLRGDEALFIEQKNFADGWTINKETQRKIAHLPEPVFFRVIVDGEETSRHGWVNTQSGEICQWG